MKHGLIQKASLYILKLLVDFESPGRIKDLKTCLKEIIEGRFDLEELKKFRQQKMEQLQPLFNLQRADVHRKAPHNFIVNKTLQQFNIIHSRKRISKEAKASHTHQNNIKNLYYQFIIQNKAPHQAADLPQQSILNFDSYQNKDGHKL